MKRGATHATQGVERSHLGHVFITCDPSDLQTATRLALSLEQAGFPSFIPDRDINGTADRSALIEQALGSASCVVLLLSDRSNRSDIVRTQVGNAYRIGKPIFPVRIEETLPSPQLELYISAKHWIDAWNGPLDQYAARLARELSGELESFTAGPALPWYRQRLWQHVATSVVLIAVVAVAISYWMTRDLRNAIDATYPATTSFAGGYIIPDKANEVTFSIQDAKLAGGSQDLGALRNLNILEIYNVVDIRSPKLVYKAAPDAFAGKFGASLGNKLSFDGLPAILVSCLSYRREDQGYSETVLQAFGFMAAGSVYGHKKFDAVSVAERKTIQGKPPASCLDLTAEYATAEIDRPDFDRRIAEAANISDPVPVQPPPPTPPKPLSERENIVGTLAMSQAFNKSFCQAPAFGVQPDTEGIAAFKAKYQITDAELAAAFARWEPTYQQLNDTVQGESCINYINLYLGHNLLERTSDVPLEFRKHLDPKLRDGTIQ